jgi:hypothetical protein
LSFCLRGKRWGKGGGLGGFCSAGVVPLGDPRRSPFLFPSPYSLKSNGTDRLLQGGDPVEAPELLPGFSVPLNQFFE